MLHILFSIQQFTHTVNSIKLHTVYYHNTHDPTAVKLPGLKENDNICCHNTHDPQQLHYLD